MIEMIKTLVADSSGLVSLATATDANHHQALALADRFDRISGSILVPSDVFSETVNVLGRKCGHQTAIQTAEAILQSDTFAVVYPDDDVFSDALDLFRQQPSAVSFTDCLVMATADYYGTRQIFGFDQAFDDNGYNTIQELLELIADDDQPEAA